MLAFLRKSLEANKPDALTELADHLVDSAKNQVKTLRKINVNGLDASYSQSVINTSLIAGLTLPPKKVSNFSSFTNMVLSSLLLYTSDSQAFSLTAFLQEIAKHIDLEKTIEKTYSDLGVPSKLLTPAIITTYGAAHVACIRYSYGFPSYSLLDFIGTTAIVSSFHYMDQTIARYIYKHVPFGQSVLMAPVIMGSNYIIHRFAAFGIKSGVSMILKSAASNIVKYVIDKDREVLLPIEVDIPNSMQCCICHDLMQDPVDSLGFFFCNKCLSSWISKEHTHPVTGEKISLDAVTKNIEMSVIVARFRSMKLQELKEAEN